MLAQRFAAHLLPGHKLPWEGVLVSQCKSNRIILQLIEVRCMQAAFSTPDQTLHSTETIDKLHRCNHKQVTPSKSISLISYAISCDNTAPSAFHQQDSLYYDTVFDAGKHAIILHAVSGATLVQGLLEVYYLIQHLPGTTMCTRAHNSTSV